jgi:hypothetical protein
MLSLVALPWFARTGELIRLNRIPAIKNALPIEYKEIMHPFQINLSRWFVSFIFVLPSCAALLAF